MYAKTKQSSCQGQGNRVTSLICDSEKTNQCKSRQGPAPAVGEKEGNRCTCFGQSLNSVLEHDIVFAGNEETMSCQDHHRIILARLFISTAGTRFGSMLLAVLHALCSDLGTLADDYH